jgi:5-methylcytosine-specific restriction endonuclease McrA
LQAAFDTAPLVYRAQLVIRRAFARESIRERFEHYSRVSQAQTGTKFRVVVTGMDLRGHKDEDLLSAVRGLIGSQRELTARLVVYLAEIEHRRLHLLAGFSSMFEFCVKALHLNEGEAFRRLAAARLGQKFPVIHSLIASGEVHLSALALLRRHLTEENHAGLLEAVRGKSKREVEMLLATRFPRQDEAARMRAISPDRFRIEFTANAELREKLERCLDLSSHANPSRDLGFVIERAVELLLAKLERERLGKAARPRRRATTSHTPDVQTSAKTPSLFRASRHVANADRRFVFERDGSRCTYVSPDGHSCEATAFLELDHVIPRGLGGGAEPENLRVRCRAHNRLWAEQTFGRAHIDRVLHFRQRKSPFDAHEQVVLALKQMGFRHAQALRAVRAVEKRQRVDGAQTLEGLLRETLLEATKAA